MDPYPPLPGLLPTSTPSYNCGTGHSKSSSLVVVKSIPRKRPSRSWACITCSRGKRKCDGVIPCQRCLRLNIPCLARPEAKMPDVSESSSDLNLLMEVFQELLLEKKLDHRRLMSQLEIWYVMSKHLKSDVSFSLIGGLCALMGMSIADLATQVEKSKEANRCASVRMHASDKIDITSSPAVDSKIPMLLIQRDHEHTHVLTNTAYDERFPTANNELLDVACNDKILNLLLSSSWVSPLDRKRFLSFAVHVFFRVIDADDGISDITERFHLADRSGDVEPYLLYTSIVHMQTENKGYLVVQIKEDKSSDEKGPEAEGVFVNQDEFKSCRGIGAWHQGDDPIDDDKQPKSGLSNDLASYDRDSVLCGAAGEGRFESMSSSLTAYSCCTVNNSP